MRACHASLWRDDEVKILYYILNKPWKSRKFDKDDIVESLHGIWWNVWADVEREWTESEDARKRKVFKSVIRPIVAQD